MDINKNKNTLTLKVFCLPVAQPRHKITTIGGRPRAYLQQTHPVNFYKSQVLSEMQKAYDGPPVEGVMWAQMTFIFPRPKSKIWKRREMPREYITKKPDIDNLIKSTLDALNGFLFRDDSQVARITAEKMMAGEGEIPHVWMRFIGKGLPGMIEEELPF